MGSRRQRTFALQYFKAHTDRTWEKDCSGDAVSDAKARIQGSRWSAKSKTKR
jgi:hypothetical protein